MISKNELIELAEAIRTQTEENANTADRVGSLLKLMIVYTADTAHELNSKISSLAGESIPQTGPGVGEGDGTSVDYEGIEGIGYVYNDTYLFAMCDLDGRILAALKKDGTFLWAKGIPQHVKDYIGSIVGEAENRIDAIEENTPFKFVENDECIFLVTDNMGRTVAGIRKDGTCFASGLSGATEWVEDSEGCMEKTVDKDGRVLASRDALGVRYESKMKLNELQFTDRAKSDLKQALQEAGFSGSGTGTDWSDSKDVILPIPEEGAMVNIIIPTSYYSEASYNADKLRSYYSPFIDDAGHIKHGLAYKKGLDWECELEFWDKKGNYFKKPIILNAQGNSSMAYEIVNQAFEFTDDSKVKFSGWVKQDSFHLKKYYIDAFRGQSIVAYRLMEAVMRSRGYGNERPWSYLSPSPSIGNGIGDFSKDFDNGALGHPDGFPVEVFCNGESLGVFTFALKKHRDNYCMNRNNPQHILLDGVFGDNNTVENDDFWGGELAWDSPGSSVGFEVRNPSPKNWTLTAKDGSVYDGDTRGVAGTEHELIDSTCAGYNPSNSSHVKTAQVKASIVRLTGALAAIDAQATTEAKKSKFEEYFNTPFLIDYVLVSEVIYHVDGFRKNWIWGTWDGQKWAPTLYDCDQIFGGTQSNIKVVYLSDSVTIGIGETPSKYVLKAGNQSQIDKNYGLFWTETAARYKALRDAGIFSVDNIMSLLDKWLEHVGYDRLKKDLVDIFPHTPSYRDHFLNSIYWDIASSGSGATKWDEDTEYAEGDKVYMTDDKRFYYEAKTDVPAGEWGCPCQLYDLPPIEGGFFNSPQRVRNWLVARFEALDTYYGYTNNN